MIELNLLIVLMIGIIICFATIAILRVHTNKSVLGTDIDVVDVLQSKIHLHLSNMRNVLTFGQYIAALCLCPVIFGSIMYVMTRNFGFGLSTALLGLFCPDGYMYFKQEKQKRLFEERYCKCLTQIASSLRAGLTIEQAINDLCQSKFVHESLREEFVQLAADLKVKIPLKIAFVRFAERTNSKDAMDVAAAITMQSEVGGNEAFVVENIAKNISSRIMMRKEIKTIFSEVSITVRIMDVLPVIILLGLMIFSPQYFTPFFADPFMEIIYFSLWIVMLIGSIITNRMLSKVKNTE